MSCLISESFRVALPIENVQDYPRPPALERVTARLRVLHQDRVIADTTDGWRVLETHHAPTYYIPPHDVMMTTLSPSTRTSFCEWKGCAVYFDLGAVRNAAWAYPEPTDRFTCIRDMLAFYAGAVDSCFVGDEQVIPQPGDFYGGWVTANLEGIVKGGPGTRGW